MKWFERTYIKADRILSLVNLPVIELTRRLLVCETLSAKGLCLLPLYYIKLILVMPAAFLQHIFYSRRISNTVIAKQPVFILGHYRSGTTYLHKLMASDKRFGFLSTYDMICPNSSLLFGSWLQHLLQYCINGLKIKTSFFNNKIPHLGEPAEEERFFINRGSAYTDYWRFVFPLYWHKWPSCSSQLKDPSYRFYWKSEYTRLLKMITLKNKGRQLVLKSPPNTDRIKYLLEIFPEAKFIYIYRNPYHVFYSMRNLWNRAIRKFCLQRISNEQVEEIVFREYAHLMEQYERNKKLIPRGNLVEVRYEQLEADPVGILGKIYEGLGFIDFDVALDDIKHQLQKESAYKKFGYTYSEETISKIERRWAKYIYQWKRQTRETTVTDYV